MKRLFSKHFNFDELTNSSSHPELVKQNRIDAEAYLSNGVALSKLLESIRSYIGLPIRVNSGYRNEALNIAVGSKAKSSSHTRFEAADIVVKGMTTEALFHKLLTASKEGEVLGIRKALHEGSWIHLEVSTKIGDYRGFFVSKDGNQTWEKIA